MIQCIIFTIVAGFLSISLVQAEIKKPDIRWSTETKLGLFQPDLPDWSEYYGSQYSVMGSQVIAYKVFPFLEIGIDGSYIYSKGQGDLPLNNTRGGEVTLEYFPLSANLTLRGRVFKHQWLVPYFGMSIGQLIYLQEITGQASVQGYVNQNYVRIGLQFLLNHFDRKATRNLYDGFGVQNTFFTAEYMLMAATEPGSNTDLSGQALLFGISLEY